MPASRSSEKASVQLGYHEEDREWALSHFAETGMTAHARLVLEALGRPHGDELTQVSVETRVDMRVHAEGLTVHAEDREYCP